MNLEKLTKEEKQELKIFLEAKIPTLEKLDDEIESVEDFYISEFERLDKELQERLANDENIEDEDLERVYLKELENLKEDLVNKAKEKFSIIQEKYEKED